ncbi:MAG TPA: tetratricopeptide repeat protein [Patescibacteria group bacterium]|nr:tetratricopeptide repeat protein [Patescibacteria group bacterium]
MGKEERFSLPPELQKRFRQAMNDHRAGKLDKAAAVYRRVLEHNPEHPPALNLLGLIALQNHKDDQGLELLQRAVKNDPDYAEAYGNLGTAFLRQHRIPEAVQALCRLTELKPEAAEAHNQYGTALAMQGDLVAAAASFERALALRPDFAAAQTNLGQLRREAGALEQVIGAIQEQRKQGNLPAAESLCRNALLKYPGQAKLHHIMGAVFFQQGNSALAVQSFEKAVALQPDYADALNNLGAIYQTGGDVAKAKNCFERALEANPHHGDALNNLTFLSVAQGDWESVGLLLGRLAAVSPERIDIYRQLAETLHKQKNLAGAGTIYRQLASMQPNSTENWKKIGNILVDEYRYEEALEKYDHALQLDPEYAAVHWNRALLLLQLGRLEEGFQEYEWRLKVPEFAPWFSRCATLPLWDGDIFSLKRLLIHDEQAMGDVLHYARYFPLVKARGGVVSLTTKKPLQRLLQGAPGLDEVIEHGSAEWDAAAYDAYIPLMSLPRIFGTTLNTIPAPMPYLTAPPEIAAAWRSRMTDGGLKIGLVWAGNSYAGEDYNRSASLAAFAPLAQIPGITYYSLQKGVEAQQAQKPPQGLNLVDWTAELKDFADTAGLVTNLDLVITVDTAVAHLSGALGIPTWTLLPYGPEWRWLLGRGDSPWYPRMRLFRQSKPGEWTPLVERICQELTEAVKRRAR